jgi:glycosyltransferase involved in cell wall biosynthesis
MQFVPQVRDAGFPIAMCPFYGLEGGVLDINGIRMYPKIGSAWGEDAAAIHSKKWGADVVITNQDIWVLDPGWLKQIPRWIAHVPVDHDPAPKAIVDRLRLCYRIVSYTKFGKKALTNEGLYSTYIPLTVETDIMKPLDKVECRKKLSIPQDYFMFGMVAANKDNPSRKSFQECMDAFKMFHDKHPKSGIYFGTILNQPGGFPIMDYAGWLGIQDFIYHIEPYDQMFSVDRNMLAQIYNTFDCYLSPSAHEGFGMTIVEAQSCGLPVITNNWVCMPELIIPDKTGFLTDVGLKWFSHLYSYWGIPSVQSIYDQMERVFKTDRIKMGQAGREYVINEYDYKKVFSDKWLPFLESCQDDIYPEKK